jgi:ATP dependent DNA ligase-like protein
LNREEFVVVRRTDPGGNRSHFGSLLLGYYTDYGRLVYAGRAGTGFTDLELKRLARVLRPLEVQRMPLDKPPPRETRFGSPLELSRVHWVRPEVVVEVTYLTGTEGGLCGRSRVKASERTSRRGKVSGLSRILLGSVDDDQQMATDETLPAHGMPSILLSAREGCRCFGRGVAWQLCLPESQPVQPGRSAPSAFAIRKLRELLGGRYGPNSPLHD